jgi:phosphatidylserine decarboxylase
MKSRDQARKARFNTELMLTGPMNTPSGFAFFIDSRVNSHLKNILDEWGRFLSSPASLSCLGTDSEGWFSDECKGALVTAASTASSSSSSSNDFTSMYICNPEERYHGYKSWDDFFTREFREGIRPIAAPEDDRVIVAACESCPYRISTDITSRDKFWAKGQPYSLLDMVNGDDLYEHFIGGTIYQAFLSALSYHRWHAPVSGTIKKSFIVPGTYFSEPLSRGFSNADGPDPSAPTLSQSYIAAVATRAVMFIEADNRDIGLMCMIAIGMAEVSTCDVTVKEGQHVKKGEQMGMFHFGGSTHCLIFGPKVKLAWNEERFTQETPFLKENEAQKNVPVRSLLAVVEGRKS